MAVITQKKQEPSGGIPLIGKPLAWLIGTRNERFVKRYTQRVHQINAMEPEIRKLTDAQLRAKTAEFRDRLEHGGGTRPDDLLVECFAVAREAMDRAVGIRNIFNPAFRDRFDASKLPTDLRQTYEKLKAEADALPPMLPSTFDPRKLTPPGAPPGAVPDEQNEFRGHGDPIGGWLRIDIPVALYEAVRKIYPQSKPPFRARPFDVQLIGGMVITQGKIAEMKTGEGKTIVAPLATYLACIENLKVHIVTVNDYLVQRDRDWTFPFFHALGLTVGAIHPQHMQPEPMKREMYRCDVVYGTTAEFGFDYLRDNMKRRVEDQVQRARQFAIVDEVDSTLIDEARTPLIISGPAHEGAPRYDLADRLAKHLVAKQKPWQEADDQVQKCMQEIKGLEGDIRNAREKEKIPPMQAQLKAAKERLPQLEKERSRHVQYYEVELERKQSHLTHDGIAEAQRIAGVGSFYVGENMDIPHLLEQSLRAHVVYQRDRDYIVAPMENPQTGRQEPSVIIVDTFTGRPMVGRQWSDGLHQAVEAKEAVPIKQETQTVATITIQNFFKMYKRLSGMTGTADTEAQEFHDIYRLDVVSIPTNVEIARNDFNDLMFLAQKDKWNTIVDEIKTFHDIGRPVLVGTTSVEKSELLAKMLTQKYGIKHEVLNAKQHEREAHIVENAGQLGQVMIATNMAGRGTDIKLGPVTREALVDHWLRRGVASRGLSAEMTEEQLRENVYRKMAPSELDVNKREVEELPFADLELRLLRHWAYKFTTLSPKKIDSMDAESLRLALDETGRLVWHRLRWFNSVEDLGGLHVVGTERHESRRIDNQLRGRSGRQGDNGSSRFFISCEDDLMKMFAGETTMKVLSRLGMKEGDAIEHSMLSKSVERAQRKVEERNFQIRKNILEYDEVMEHQRQAFYGLRQRVLEGRDVRGLIFDYIRDAAKDAVRLYLDKHYAANCASEYVRQHLDVTIFPERLRGMELDEMIERIRKEGKEELRSKIAVTLGEYLPHEAGEFEVDFDAEGLARWAKTFGVEFDPRELQEKGASRRQIEDALADAAGHRLDEADLTGLARFVNPDYGPQELCDWADNKFGIKLTLEEVKKAGNENPEKVETLIMEQAEALYRKREIEYPVEFSLEMAKSIMQQNPLAGAQALVDNANRRYGLGWGPDVFKSMTPQQARQRLLEASEKFVDEGVLQKKVDEALACKDWDALVKWWKLNIGGSAESAAEPPALIRTLKDEERDNAIIAGVESVFRRELLHLERTILLEVLDDLWKGHLYSMDQLRDGINFRSFSQQDPRIEYKREGSKLFAQMLEEVRDRVTDLIFRAQMRPQFGPPGAGVGGGVPPMAPPPGAGSRSPAMGPGRPLGPSPYYQPPAQPPAAPAGPGAAGLISGAGGIVSAPPSPAPATPPASSNGSNGQNNGSNG